MVLRYKTKGEDRELRGDEKQCEEVGLVSSHLYLKNIILLLCREQMTGVYKWKQGLDRRPF